MDAVVSPSDTATPTTQQHNPIATQFDCLTCGKLKRQVWSQRLNDEQKKSWKRKITFIRIRLIILITFFCLSCLRWFNYFLKLSTFVACTFARGKTPTKCSTEKYLDSPRQPFGQQHYANAVINIQFEFDSLFNGAAGSANTTGARHNSPPKASWWGLPNPERQIAATPTARLSSPTPSPSHPSGGLELKGAYLTSHQSTAH